MDGVDVIVTAAELKMPPLPNILCAISDEVAVSELNMRFDEAEVAVLVVAVLLPNAPDEFMGSKWEDVAEVVVVEVEVDEEDQFDWRPLFTAAIDRRTDENR